MKELFIIAILILAAYALLYFIVRPRWWRIVWCICSFLAAGLSAPFLIEVTPESYQFLTYFILVALVISGIAPLAEKK